jgi:hypothetical protein
MRTYVTIIKGLTMKPSDLILVTGLLVATPSYSNETDCVNCEAKLSYNTGLENILRRHQEITQGKMELFLKMSQDPSTAHLYHNPIYSSGAEASMGLSWSPYEMRPQHFYGSWEDYPQSFYHPGTNPGENHFKALPYMSEQDSFPTYPEFYPGVFGGSSNSFDFSGLKSEAPEFY